MGAMATKSGDKTRILVVDDHPLLREALASVINRQKDFVCCGVAGSALEAQKAVSILQPDLVLLDLWLNGGDGLELIKSFKSQFPSLQILVLSQFDEALYAERSLRAGALGYVMKEQPSKEVLAAIRTVLGGEIYVSPRVAARVLHKACEMKRENRNGRVENLTDRELQVLQLLGAGMSTRKIADELTLSFKTVETHRENIKRKLGLGDAVELIRYAADWVRGQSFSSSRGIPQAVEEVSS
jgi:DNA-binding NarL/FixJ family response regulator